MKPLIVLISTFIVCLVITRLSQGSFKWAQSGQIGMSAMLLFTSIGHFAFSKGMSMMLPDFVPYKLEVVYLTGIIEIAAAIGLFVPAFRILTGWLLIAFFVFILPANIHAAIKHIDYQRGTFDGNGIVYLWFRIPLQLFFIAWTYFFTIKN
jgi:uncharacterized membrane protein